MKLYITKSDVTGEKNIVADDMILTTKMPTTGASMMLDGYVSCFDAQVINNLEDAGYTIKGKANTGEFNLGLLGETSYFGAVTDDKGNLQNPCAEIVKSGDAQAAVMLDVNGMPRRAAAINSLVYVKPTYGTVSRFGTIAAASSGDVTGVMAKDVEKVREVLDVIAGHDAKDGTSLPEESCALLKKDAQRKEVKKIAVAKALVDLADDETKAKIDAFIKTAKENGAEVTEIDAKKLLLAKATWNIIMSAEFCSSVSRFDGVKYGHRAKEYTNIDELYTNSRTEAFGYLVKQTILFGSDTLATDNYMKIYDKALRMRRVIKEELDKIFEEYDAILAPVTSKCAYTEKEAKENNAISYEESVFTAPASLTGIPTVVAQGVQLIGNVFSENSLLDFFKKTMKEGK